MSMHDRYAKDLSSDLFESVYDDLFMIATEEQKAIHQSCTTIRKGKAVTKNYHVGEAQEMLNSFTFGKTSLGDALTFIKTRRALNTPLVQ